MSFLEARKWIRKHSFSKDALTISFTVSISNNWTKIQIFPSNSFRVNGQQPFPKLKHVERLFENLLLYGLIWHFSWRIKLVLLATRRLWFWRMYQLTENDLRVLFIVVEWIHNFLKLIPWFVTLTQQYN